MTLIVGVLLALLALSSTVGAGLELELSRVRADALWRPLAAALLANLIVIPLGSLLLLRSVHLPASSFAGLALVALSPGGASAPLLATTLARMLVLVVVSLAAGALTVQPRLPDALLACVRNLTLALMIAEAQEPGGAATLVVAAYGLVMYVVASLCLVARKRARGSAQEYP